MKAICTGQEQFKCACCIDQNRNGMGEYGFLAELGGTKACRGGGMQFESNPPPWHAALTKGRDKGWFDTIGGKGWNPTG